MVILAIETTGPFSSVALKENSGQVVEFASSERLNHLQSLTPLIERVLEKSELEIGDVDAIAVSVGPGSFTGIRIGVSTARALGQVLGLKLIPISTLSAFAFGKLDREPEKKDKLICTILDARRNQIYGAAYKNNIEIAKAAPYMLQEFLDIIENEKDILFIGDGVIAYKEQIEEWAKEKNKDVSFEDDWQRASYIMSFAKHMIETKEDIYVDYGELKPNYMRTPEAERRLKEKTK